MLKTAYNSGVKAAYARFKVALPVSGQSLGADYGVAPAGPEMSHGTQLNAYPPRQGANPPTDTASHTHGQDANALWNLSEYNRWAPGSSGGQFGQETIG